MKVLSVTTMRDEGPYLLEWIAWQRAIGVTDFLIYTNDCSDGTDLLLDKLHREGVVYHEKNPAAADESLQWSALRAAWRHDLRKSTDWMMISDVDEFPMIHAGDHRLEDLFATIPEESDAITMPWRLFGSDGNIDLQDTPITEQFLRSAPTQVFYPIATTFFKSLFRPSAFARPGVHRPRQHKNKLPNWLDGDGKDLAPKISEDHKRLSLLGSHEARSLVELHHYSLRSAQAFIVKSARGLPNQKHKAIDIKYWIARNYNTIENRAALSMQEAMQAEREVLFDLSGVADLHDKSFSWHRQRFDKLIRSAEYYELFTEILLAQESAVLSPKMAMNLFKLYARLGNGGVQEHAMRFSP